MFKTRYKIISFFLIMSIVMSFATLSVNAGTMGSNGSHGSAGGGKGSISDDRYLNNCFIDWSKVSSESDHDFKNIKGINPSSMKWSDWVSTVTDGGASIDLKEQSSDIAKWCAVIKYTGAVKYYPKDGHYFLWYGRQNASWKFFRWQWWYDHFVDPDEVASDMHKWQFWGLNNPLRDNNGNNKYTNVLRNGKASIWMNGLDIPDADLVDAAHNDEYYYNTNYHMWKRDESDGGKKLDIVWVTKNAMEAPKCESKTVLIKTIGANNDYDYTSKDAEWLWDNCPTSATYYGKSADGQYTYNKTVQGWDVVLTHKWQETGGNKVPGSDSYTRGSVNELAGRKFTYTVNAPSVNVERFNALDLNRNGNALSSDVAADFGYTPASGKNLKADVDNGLNITDGTALPALDSNNVVPFQLTFNNNQFGIPTAAQGGYDIETNSSGVSPVKDASGNYDISASFAEGSTKQQISAWLDQPLVTGETILSPTGQNFAGQSTISNKTHYWTGSNLQLQAFTNKPNSSLVCNGNEYTYKQGSSATRVPISAISSASNASPQVETIKFRSIKSGDYKLSNNASKDWWTVSYQGGKLYTYGVEFEGTIVAGHGINPPTLRGHDFYVATATTSTIQPILKGNFNVKSVGGDI